MIDGWARGRVGKVERKILKAHARTRNGIVRFQPVTKSERTFQAKGEVRRVETRLVMNIES